MNHIFKRSKGKLTLLLLTILITTPSAIGAKGKVLDEFPPKQYTCHKVSSPLTIDGKLDEKDWVDAQWTDYFLDIQGPKEKKPRFKTRAKMLWDDEYLYVAAEMIEPDVWANIKQHDAVIFYDNDFEIFIDPDGDGHHYEEFEMNAFNTVWDLILTKGYRDGNFAIDNWDFKGLKSGVHVYGTINDPSDKDDKWTVEVAIPIDAINECSTAKKVPAEGKYWRINFSRVEWQTEVKDGKYVKLTDPKTGKSLPEDNWVWSPQYVINMHEPEHWGFLFFTENSPSMKSPKFEVPEYEAVKFELYELYNLQRNYYNKNNEYTSNLSTIEKDYDVEFELINAVKIYTTPSTFEAVVTMQDGKTVHITHDGKAWVK